MFEQKQQKENVFNNAFVFKGESPFVAKPPQEKIKKKPHKSIDDLDTSLILSTVNKNVTNKSVLLKIKINTLEKELKVIDEKIEYGKLLKLPKEDKKLEHLKDLKKQMETQLTTIKKEARELNILYSYYGFLAEKFKFVVVDKIFKFCKNKCIEGFKFLAQKTDNFKIIKKLPEILLKKL
ncbi:MAG: hypothetical protein PHX18_08080 [Candidatus Gastranaerophilales bacterium]|nr:hypothetical protein [Candidatus Gastranaerophilales bacterium]